MFNYYQMWKVRGEENSGGTGETGGTGGTGETGGSTKEAELQAELDKAKKSAQSAIDELNSLKAKSSLSQKDLDALNKRIGTLQNEIATKEELARQQQETIRTELQTKLEKQEKESERWRNLYTDTTIVRSIQDACLNPSHEAFNPQHIVAILKPDTKMIEEIGPDNKPTGNLVPQVIFRDTDGEGKPITLQLSVSDAVKRLSEKREHFALFKGKGSGGLGGTNVSGDGAQKNANELAKKDTGAYIRARQKGEIQL